MNFSPVLILTIKKVFLGREAVDFKHYLLTYVHTSDGRLKLKSNYLNNS